MIAVEIRFGKYNYSELHGMTVLPSKGDVIEVWFHHGSEWVEGVVVEIRHRLDVGDDHDHDHKIIIELC